MKEEILGVKLEVITLEEASASPHRLTCRLDTFADGFVVSEVVRHYVSKVFEGDARVMVGAIW